MKNLFKRYYIPGRRRTSVVNQIVNRKIKQDIVVNMKRDGAVIGISGGIDSTVCFALAAQGLI